MERSDDTGVAVRYSKVLCVRLFELVERFMNEAPELCLKSGFREAWSVAQSLRAEVLLRAAREPLLDIWVSTAERLVARRIHIRYPDAHPLRHLREFALLLAGWAEMISGCETAFRLPRRQVIPLSFGRLLLVLENEWASQPLSWRLRSQVLRLQACDRVLAEIDLKTDHLDLAERGISIIRPPAYGVMKVDVWTPEYIGGQEPTYEMAQAAMIQAEIASEMENQATPLQSDFISSFCRCVTLVDGTEWTAGLAGWPAGNGQSRTPVSLEALLELACRDKIRRLLKLLPPRLRTRSSMTGREIDDALVDAGAKRAVFRMLGAAEQDGQRRNWELVLAQLLDCDRTTQLLVEMGESIARQAVPLASNGTDLLSVSGALKKSIVRTPVQDDIGLRKTRRCDDHAADFGLIDRFAAMAQSDLDRILTSMQAQPTSEGHSYAAAASAYVLGRFEDCRQALLRCLAFDSDVEEYWQLLAFTYRHMRAEDVFQDMIFTELSSPISAQVCENS